MAVEIADWRITLWASQLWVDLFCQWKQPGGSQQRLNSFDLNRLLSLSLNSRRSYRKHQIWRRPSFAGALRRPRCAKKGFTTLSHEEIHTILDHEFHEECVLQATIFSVGSATMRTASLPMGEGLNGLKTFFTLRNMRPSHWLIDSAVRCSSVQFGAVRSENWITRYGELRATDTVFKTELCRWWANGSCKAGHFFSNLIILSFWFAFLWSHSRFSRFLMTAYCLTTQKAC